MTYFVRASAFAPGSIGNVGPALDVLGAAVTGPGDLVVAEWCDATGVVIRESGHPELPLEASLHAAGLAAQAVVRAATALGVTQPACGIALTVTKGLALSSGQGGSAASAVAGGAAVNALLGSPLDERALLGACLTAEEAVAGRHLDNIAPSLLGGIVIIRSLDPIDVVRLPVPERLRVVLAHPNQRLRTAEARRVLPEEIPRALLVHQMAQVAAMVAAFHSGDLGLLGRAIDDRIAEPARAPLLPGFVEAKRAALGAGALGASISGSGPSAFAFCDGDTDAERVADAMRASYSTSEIDAEVRIAHIDTAGARVETHRSGER